VGVVKQLAMIARERKVKERCWDLSRDNAMMVRDCFRSLPMAPSNQTWILQQLQTSHNPLDSPPPDMVIKLYDMWHERRIRKAGAYSDDEL
jgi:hypothetical protein